MTAMNEYPFEHNPLVIRKLRLKSQKTRRPAIPPMQSSNHPAVRPSIDTRPHVLADGGYPALELMSLERSAKAGHLFGVLPSEARSWFPGNRRPEDRTARPLKPARLPSWSASRATRRPADQRGNRPRYPRPQLCAEPSGMIGRRKAAGPLPGTPAVGHEAPDVHVRPVCRAKAGSGAREVVLPYKLAWAVMATAGGRSGLDNSSTGDR